MRRRRRWLAAAAILLLVGGGLVALAGPGLETPLALLLRRDSTWRNMEARGTWRVGMDPSFPPFQSLDETGAPVGFDVELARQMAQAWGLEAEIVAIGFDSLPDALKAARIDSIVSAYPYDPRLTRDFAFSQPYFEAGLRLAARTGSTLASLAGLAGKQVAVEWGSEGDMVGRRLQREGITVTLLPFATPLEVIQALATDTSIDAALVDNVTLRQAQEAGLAVVAIGEALESNPYVIVAPRRATELQTRIDATLKQLQQQGALAELERRWFAMPATWTVQTAPMP